ncbi:hypothetical protein CHARACLAT_006456 [Characodon lateralis]|uniref:Uncharacterized protein n=1 Tax=Characodon lateralis TaxID=208331 RepID=A0ABU7EH10_9TELE|nr:hypothetical protein [Characodon lateralis]
MTPGDMCNCQDSEQQPAVIYSNIPPLFSSRFCMQKSAKLVPGVTLDLIEKIPGRLNDRRTPLGELNWIFTAITDTIAWNVLPRGESPGIHYRKSCASSGACLIASSGYQQFCTGRLNSVCITCCNTPLCNGPKRKRPVPSAATSNRRALLFLISPLLLHLTSCLGF